MMGLGFNFGAQDKGLGAAIKTTSSGLADISKSVVGIGADSAKMMFKAPDFGPAAGVATTLANDVKLTTTGMEAFGVAASKATSAGLAGLNLTAKEFGKAQGMISGVAFGMNTDVGAVTKSFTALKQAGVDVKKVGFKSFEEYQKFIEVTGTDSIQFAGALGKMSHQMGLTAEQTTATVKSVAAIGKHFNIGREAISAMSDTVEVLNDNANLLPQDWSPARLQKFISGTTIVAGALTSVGFTADEAIGASKDLTKSLLDGGKGMHKLYSGLADTIPNQAEVITQNLGNFEDSFQMLQNSPDKFMLKMGKMMDKVQHMNLKPEALDRFRLQMSETFGPKAMAVFTKKGFGQIGPALEKASEPMEGQEKILGDLASKYQDGRTMAEHFAIAQDQMHTALKHVSGVMGDQEYLKNYKTNTKALVVELGAFAKKGGVLGKATDMFIEFTNYGIGGALAAHTKWGLALTEGVKLMQPVMAFLPGLTAAFSALTSPITLVAGAIAAIYFASKDLAKGDKSIIRPFIEKIKTEAPAFFAKVKDVFIDIVKAVKEVAGMIDWKAVKDFLYDGFLWAFNGISDVIGMIDWGVVASTIGHYLGVAIDFAVESIGKILKGIGHIIADWWHKASWGDIYDVLKDVFLVLGAFSVYTFVSSFGGLGGMLKSALTSGLGIAFKAAKGLIGGAINGIGDVMTSSVGQMAASTEAAAGSMSGSFFEMDAGLASIDVAAGETAAASTVASTEVAAGWAAAILPITLIVGAVAAVGYALYKLFGDSRDESKDLKDALSRDFSTTKKELSPGGSGDFATPAGRQISLTGITFSSVFGEARKNAMPGGSADMATPLASQFKIISSTGIDSFFGIKTSMDPGGKGDIGGAMDVQAGKVKKTTAQINADVVSSVKSAINSVTDVAKKTSDNVVASAKAAGEESIRANKIFMDKISDYYNETKKHLDLAKNLKFGSVTDDAAGNAEAAVATQTKLNNLLQIQKNLFKSMQDSGEQLDLFKSDSFKKDKGQFDAVTNEIERLQKTKKEQSDELTKSYSGDVNILKNSSIESQKLFMSASDTIKKYSSTLGAEQLNDFSVQSIGLQRKYTEDLTTLRTKLSAAIANGNAGEQKSIMDQMARTTSAAQDSMHALQKSVESAAPIYSGSVQEMMNGVTKIITDSAPKTGDALVTGIVKSKDKAKDAAGKIGKAAASAVVETFSATPAQAADMSSMFANMDLGKFRKNIHTVRDDIGNFLTTVDESSKKMVKDTNDMMNKFFKDSKAGWDNQTGLLQIFSSIAAASIATFWASAIISSTNASVNIIKIFGTVTTAMDDMAKNFNIMDLLASPDKITQWAASVVDALSYAFRNGNAIDSMIGASYQKALSMASQIHSQASPAVPDQSAMASPASSSMNGLTGLISTIDHPKWAENVQATLNSINENLSASLASKGEKAAPTPKPIKSPKVNQGS